MQEDIYSSHKQQSIYWYNKAADLRGSAGVLWSSMGDERSAEIVKELGLGKGFRIEAATGSVYKMLCGMALELIYKAITVAKGKEPNTRSHKLTSLALDAGVSYLKDVEGLLDILSESISWDGRYPVPQKKKKKDMKRLNELKKRHLYEKRSYGEVNVLVPNHALDWNL